MNLFRKKKLAMGPDVTVEEAKQVTIVLEPCENHPTLASWPDGNLIRGVCPACACWVDNGKESARVLRARRLIEEAGDE